MIPKLKSQVQRHEEFRIHSQFKKVREFMSTTSSANTYILDEIRLYNSFQEIHTLKFKNLKDYRKQKVYAITLFLNGKTQ